jgi:hypothetical protein
MNRPVEAHPETHLNATARAAGGWAPLAWSPIDVRCAAGVESQAGEIARIVVDARDALEAATGSSAPVRLRVGAGTEVAAYRPRTGAILAGAGTPPGFAELARMLDDRLPPRARASLRARWDGDGAVPLDLAAFVRTLAIDAYAASLAHAAGASFPRRWIAIAFEASARVVSLATSTPETLARQAQLAESVAAVLPPASASAAAAVADAVERLEATRVAVHVFERRGAAVLARFLRTFPAGMAPRSDAQVARLVLRELGGAAVAPSTEALAA